MHQGQLTPNSISSEPRNLSTFTPNPRLTPTEDYFAPRMSGQNSLSSSPRPIPRSSGRESLDRQNGKDAEPRSVSESPSSFGNSTFLKRMNTIAPGPFDTTHRPSRVTSRHQIPPRKSSIGRKEDTVDTPAVDMNAQERPGTAASTRSTGSNNNVTPPRIPSKNGYEGFGPPLRSDDELEPQPLGLINRSETFPRPSAPPEPPVRTLSTPGNRPDRIKSVLDEAKRPSMMGPDTSRLPPPRKSILRPQAAKLAGSIDLAAEFGANNPYHTPSDSGSSGYSTFSRPSHSSSHTSPEKHKPRRQASDTSDIDELMSELQNSIESLRSTELRIDLPPPPRTRSPLVESPLETSSREEVYDPAVQSGRRSPKKYDQQLPSPQLSVSPLNQASFDPAVQKVQRRAPTPQGYEQPLPSPQYGTSPRDQHYFDPAVQKPRKLDALPASAPPPVRKGSRDPSAPRGDCKACKLPIKGKSISSADGRLTGKYHKACFVCSTCSEPFTSAEFYVLDDKPYCEQHYHKLNGSLCGSCGRGIEGQYLEDEFEIKYHVGCFRCLDCGRSLSEGYFEVDGKSYCERDAWRRVQQPWLAGKGLNTEHDSSLHPPPRGGPRQSNGHATGGNQGRQSQRPSGLGMGFPRPPYGMPAGNRLSPNMAATPRMNKRNTRLGMM